MIKLSTRVSFCENVYKEKFTSCLLTVYKNTASIAFTYKNIFFAGEQNNFVNIFTKTDSSGQLESLLILKICILFIENTFIKFLSKLIIYLIFNSFKINIKTFKSLTPYVLIP